MLPSERGGRAEHRSDQGIVGGRQVVDRRNVLARDDEHVQRRLRIDVLDRDDVVVLMDDRPLDLTRDDFAEETVAHGLWMIAVRAIPCRSSRMWSTRSEARAPTSRRTSSSCP